MLLAIAPPAPAVQIRKGPGASRNLFSADGYRPVEPLALPQELDMGWIPLINDV